MSKDITLAIIKPNAVRDKHVGKIVSMIEESGFDVLATKSIWLSKKQAAQFYAEHTGKPFYESLVEFMTSGPCVVFVLSCEHAVMRWRELMGATDPGVADPGTIRRLYGTSVQQNACHGSDSPESARREVAFFFSYSEIIGNRDV